MVPQLPIRCQEDRRLLPRSLPRRLRCLQLPLLDLLPDQGAEGAAGEVDSAWLYLPAGVEEILDTTEIFSIVITFPETHSRWWIGSLCDSGHPC